MTKKKLNRVPHDAKYYHVLHTRLEGMRIRCNTKTCPEYKYYGARGIKICKEWSIPIEGFYNFYTWAMNNGFSPELSIDRIDNNAGYSPSNCRWATLKQQANNTRNTIVVKNVITNESWGLSDFCKLNGYKYQTVRTRIAHKWNPFSAILAKSVKDKNTDMAYLLPELVIISKYNDYVPIGQLAYKLTVPEPVIEESCTTNTLDKPKDKYLYFDGKTDTNLLTRLRNNMYITDEPDNYTLQDNKAIYTYDKHNKLIDIQYKKNYK